MRKSAFPLFILGLCIAIQTNAQYPQQHRMMLPTQNIDFTVDPPVMYNSPGSSLGSGTSDVSNGAHGVDGRPLFYVNKGHIINRFGQDIGALQYGTYAYLDNEIMIVPVRNFACRYYVIYTFVENKTDPSLPCGVTTADKFKTYSALLDMSMNNGVGAILQNGVPIDECSDIGFKSAMAVYWPDPTSPTQYLYRAVTSTSGIVVRRFTIGPSTIGSPVLVANITSVNMPHISEMDISSDGSMMAMVNASYSNSLHDVLIVHLGSNGLLNSSMGNHAAGLSTFNVNNLSDGIFVGQEFSLNQQYLYVSHHIAGIYRLTLGTGAVSFISSSANHGNSQLEMSYHPTGNHKILAANTAGIGAILNPESSTPTFNPTFLLGAVAANDLLHYNSKLLPDQMDGMDYMGYQMYVAPNCCKAFAFDVLSYTASGTGSITWTPTSNPFYNQDIISIRDELVIPSGRTLTIQNLELRFDQLAKIRVLPNAHLIIDNSKLTKVGECETDRWRGIYVSGNSTASQTLSPALFGKLTVKNGAIIEHVQDGICNYGLTSGGSTDWASFGGIIQARQSSFLNNRYGPYFGPYSNFVLSGSTQIPVNDLSYIDRCEFRTDANFGSATPIDQLTFWGTRGADVWGSHFHNTRTSDGNPVGRGRGIYSIDAVYTVKDHCAIIPPSGQPCPAQYRTPSRFERLHRGIEATGGATATAITTVWESEFTDNHRGIVLNNTQGSKVQRNIFRPGLTGPTPVGLYIDQTFNYTVDCNTFTTTGATAPIGHADQRYGATSINCGGASPITKNTFTGLYVGAQALGSNRTSGAGLQYLSNTFNGNYIGIIALQSGTLANQGIAISQGTVAAPAGNLFSTASTLLDFYNWTGSNVTYRHHAGTGAWIPTIITSTTTLAPTTVPWNLWSCEEKKQQSMALYLDDTEQQQAKSSQLAAITDGGNTTQLQTQVAGSANDADMQVYGTLMQKSPNLSESVLLTAVERPAPLPNAMLRDVLTSNPQAGKSEVVMAGLADRPLQLPDYMVWQVEQSSASVSPMENLRADVASLATQRQQTAEGLLDRWLMPESGQPVHTDSANALLIAKDDAHAHYRLALFSAAEGDAQTAAHHAGLLGQRADGPGVEAAQRLASMLTLVATAKAEGRNIVQYTEGELAQLTTLASGEDMAAGHAEAILAFVNGTEIDYPVLPVPPMPQQRRAAPSMEGMSSLNIFPNPGSDHVTIDYAFQELDGMNSFEVIDVQGRILLTERLIGQRDQMILDIRALASGSYIYRVVQNGTTLHSGNFSVVRD